MEHEKAEEAENAPVSLVADDENDDENIVDDDVERREAMLAAVSASKSNDDEEIASIKRRNVIKLTAEMFWTLGPSSECGYNDIYEDIIASKFVHEADEVYATYALHLAEISEIVRSICEGVRHF